MKTAFPKPLVLQSKTVTRQFTSRKSRIRKAPADNAGFTNARTGTRVLISHAGQVKNQSADGARSRRGILPVYFGSPRGIISSGDCHHELRSPRGRTDLAASEFKGEPSARTPSPPLRGRGWTLSSLTQARRRRRATGGGGWEPPAGTPSSADRSDRVRRGVCGAAPAHEGARRARAASGERSPSPPPARAGHGSPVWAAGPGGGGPAGAEPRKRAERFSGRVIGAPWRSRELAATATGAATALRRATQVTTRPRWEGVAGVVGVGGA